MALRATETRMATTKNHRNTNAKHIEAAIAEATSLASTAELGLRELSARVHIVIMVYIITHMNITPAVDVDEVLLIPGKRPRLGYIYIHTYI